jgi:cyanate permease
LQLINLTTYFSYQRINMQIELHFISFVCSVPIAFIFSRAKRTWVAVAGLFLGWLIGFIVALFFGLLVNKGDETAQISAMAQSFWVTFVFSCLGTYFGRKKHKKTDSQ